MDFVQFDAGDVATWIGIVGSGIGLYVAFDRRLTKVEAQQTGQEKRMDKQDALNEARFKEQGDRLERALDRISEQLSSINDRLAEKADRH